MTVVTYRVPYADTDRMQVVYHANYFIYFERFRNEILRDNGITYKELETGHFFMPVIDAHCHYMRPAVYDDLLQITGKVAEITGVRIRLEYEIRRGDELLVTGYTVHACIDSKTGRPRRLPEQIRNLAGAC